MLNRSKIALFLLVLCLITASVGANTDENKDNADKADKGERAIEKKTCQVEKEETFRMFNVALMKQYPKHDVVEAVAANPDARKVVTSIKEGAPDSILAVNVESWADICPEKYTNVFTYGITVDKDICWVIQPLWVVTCTEKRCLGVIENVAYFNCRQQYTRASFWVYCRDGTLRLLTRYIPSCCECRRFFCPYERQLPTE